MINSLDINCINELINNKKLNNYLIYKNHKLLMALQFLSLPSETTMTKSVDLMKKHKSATIK